MEPITASADADLRYDEWEYERKMKVEEASQGGIGYVHLRAMSTGSWERWVREFYSVFNRYALHSCLASCRSVIALGRA